MTIWKPDQFWLFIQKPNIHQLLAPSRTCMYLGEQGDGEVCLKLILRATPLNVGELKV